MAKGNHSYIIRYDLNGRECYHSESNNQSELHAVRFESRKDAEAVASDLESKGFRKVTIVKVGLRRR